MNTEDAIKISEAEWEVMRVIWTLGESDAATINDVLKEKMQWKFATVKTLLGRLVKKEALKTRQVGKKYLYSALISEEKSIHEATQELFSRICATRMAENLTQMIEEVELTPTDVAQLIQTLQKKQTVEKITCNCIPGQCQCDHNQVKFA
ncbi:MULTISPECIES: CopY/TcrY family copper transport repressor [Enterococcus]|uniref:Uracil phosphoribosyltransferase n=1 Tax=Enterococcus alcedinis TaxID=1274384 RepID=A0A917N6J6_9ENTE|nr:CopY/TcrY family copper transport repressor [Enterococcus alcedinis]MBP2102329.1 CopY/TcrY family copper transport repressor [Enterococcus alcedinis]GGI65887.1 uracil phosphoribosyltransferase [Enterococcus alcedinis]